MKPLRRKVAVVAGAIIYNWIIIYFLRALLAKGALFHHKYLLSIFLK